MNSTPERKYLHLVRPDDAPQEIVAAQAHTRDDIRSALHVVHLNEQMRNQLDHLIGNIESGGDLSTPETHILHILETHPTDRREIAEYIGTRLIDAATKKVRSYEKNEFKGHFRAGIVPMALAHFAVLVEKTNPQLATTYRTAFLELYSRIMGDASDEELRMSTTVYYPVGSDKLKNAQISGDWPNYMHEVQREIIVPILKMIATRTLGGALEDAFKLAEPIFKKFDAQMKFIGTNMKVLSKEDILHTFMTKGNLASWLGVEDTPSLRETCIKNLKTYLSD